MQKITQKNVPSDLIQFVQKHQEMSTSDAVCCRERCLVKMNINSMYEAWKQFRELFGEKQRERILNVLNVGRKLGFFHWNQ